jgi:hypothetical protein
MDHGHHGLAAGLDTVADIGQERLDRGLAEFADIGTGDESLALPTMTTALTAALASACSMAAIRPWRTAAPSALTGGLLTLTSRTSPSCLSSTTEVLAWAVMRVS